MNQPGSVEDAATDGDWNFNINGFESQVRINPPGQSGVLTLVLLGNEFDDYWDEPSQTITFFIFPAAQSWQASRRRIQRMSLPHASESGSWAGRRRDPCGFGTSHTRGPSRSSLAGDFKAQCVRVACTNNRCQMTAGRSDHLELDACRGDPNSFQR